MLGHEYLTTIGILHRDISENNIVLGLRPGDERGYLIDLDMAILQNAEEPTEAGPAKPLAILPRRSTQQSSTLAQPDQKNMKALRTVRTLPISCWHQLTGILGNFSLHFLQRPLGRSAYAIR